MFGWCDARLCAGSLLCGSAVLCALDLVNLDARVCRDGMAGGIVCATGVDFLRYCLVYNWPRRMIVVLARP